MVAIIGAVGIPKTHCGKKHCTRFNVNYSILNRFNLVRMEEFCTRSFGFTSIKLPLILVFAVAGRCAVQCAAHSYYSRIDSFAFDVSERFV